MRIMLALYGWSLRLLPEWLRRRAGAEMLATFAARLSEARGVRARTAALLHELGGLLRVAVAARLTGRRAHADDGRYRRSPLLETVMIDLRYALRGMRRTPSIPLLAVLTLGLGVGTSTAMFSIVNGVLLKPLPFARPDQIVFVYPTIEDWRDHPSLSGIADRGRFSSAEMALWLERQQSFESAAGMRVMNGRVPSGRGAVRVSIALGTLRIFETLGVKPALGRLFDTTAEAEPVAVLSYSYWQTHHGGDPGIIGRDIVINDAPVRAIGVLPPEFEVPGAPADLWQPLAVSAAGSIDNHSMYAIARLRDGVTHESAEAETAQLLAAISATDPGHSTHHARLVTPVAEATASIRVPLLILTFASVLLLGAACANVALLLLGAGADRVRELAVRRALGAGKRRIARQLLTESVLLSVIGTAAGLLMAVIAVKALLMAAPDGLPRVAHVAVDLRTFSIAAALAIVSGLLVGCFPALALSRVEAVEAMRSGATAPGRGRLQHGIVVVQLALATVLLVGAGLLTRTMSELQRVQPGFNPDGLLTVELALPYERLTRPDESDAEFSARLNAYTAGLRRSIESVAGVEEVALTSNMPYSGDRAISAIQVEGYEPAAGAPRFVSGNYFATMQIPALQGRLLTPQDDRADAEPVMVVTDRFARHFWGDGDWLNHSVSFWETTYRVVGVIADTREHDLRGDEDRHKYYVAAASASNSADNLIIRTGAEPEALMPALRDRIWTMDPTLVLTDMRIMRERISGSIASYRYRMRLMVGFSGIAALFCLLGIYGVMSRSVARRRQELGIRVALGAERGRILSLVLGDGLRIGVLGTSLGLFAAYAATRMLETMLWGVPATDPVTFAVIAGLLLVLAVAASLLPARRAAAVEPMATLRG
jgi:predicted permease